jgi:hypothetical protein
VIAVMILQIACLSLPSPTLSRLVCCCTTLFLCLKHIALDSLVPPPLVLAVSAGVSCACLHAHLAGRARLAKFALMFLQLSTAGSCLLMPLQTVRDTFPPVRAGTEVAELLEMLVRVVAFYK